MDIGSLNEEELKAYLTGLGEQPFRARQIFQAIHKENVLSINDITTLSKNLRSALLKDQDLDKLSILKEYRSKVDDSVKLLYELADKNIIEGVLMKYKHGYSLCLSTQVGCRMGCSFCASTKEGLVRNLTPYEMCQQIYRVERAYGINISNVILMGSGEPLDNYDNVVRFFDIINSKNGKNLSLRNITLSTSGLVNRIYDLAKRKEKVNLAISLHASRDDYRKEIMPVARRHCIEEIISAAKFYSEQTSSRITFEYTVIENLNNTDADVERLSKLLSGFRSHINLIPLNPVDGFKGRGSGRRSMEILKDKLEKRGLSVTIRRSLGVDINASCGQLRIKHLTKEVDF